MAEVPRAGAEETDAAVARAPRRRSRPGARSRPRSARGCCIASPTRSRSAREELATLEARNAGKPIADARGEIGMVAETFRYYAGAPRAAAGRHDPGRRRRRHDLPRAARRRRPDRALELPADDRLLEGGAGAGGRQHGRAEAGRADPADGARAGADRARGRAAGGRAERRRRARAASAASAWSSTPTSPRSPSPARPRSGAGSPRGAAATIKRVTLELGGKSANVVFADADLEAAAAAGADGGVRQRRPGLLRALADPRRALRRSTSSWPRWSARSTAMRVGDPLDDETQMGPLISADQRETVVLVRRRRRPGRDPRLGPRRARVLVRADRALPGLERRPRRRARRSSARSPA